MEIKVSERNGSRVAVVVAEDVVLTGTQDALDLIATVNHVHGCGGVLLPADCVCPEFFDLRTGIAGEVLQKCVNYSMRVAVVGDFSGYASKALRDFIRESNRGKHVFFLSSEEEGLEALHGAADA